MTKIAPLIAPKATKMTKTFQGISGDIVPNGYKGFGANPRQYRVQEKGGVRLRNPVLYPPELQGQELLKALPAKSLQWSRRISLHGQSARLPPKGPNGPRNSPLFDLQSTLKRRSFTGTAESRPCGGADMTVNRLVWSLPLTVLIALGAACGGRPPNQSQPDSSGRPYDPSPRLR